VPFSIDKTSRVALYLYLALRPLNKLRTLFHILELSYHIIYFPSVLSVQKYIVLMDMEIFIFVGIKG